MAAIDARDGAAVPARGESALLPRHQPQQEVRSCWDLGKPAGRDVFLDLVAPGRRVWENFRPGVMARWASTTQALASVNPRLVMCSLSAYRPGRAVS